MGRPRVEEKAKGLSVFRMSVSAWQRQYLDWLAANQDAAVLQSKGPEDCEVKVQECIARGWVYFDPARSGGWTDGMRLSLLGSRVREVIQLADRWNRVEVAEFA
jgi:hypothetical protein